MVIVAVPDAVDLRAHLPEHRGQVDDLRLAGGVVDHRDAVGQHRGHQDVLGRADAGKVQADRRAVQLWSPADHLAVLDVHRRAHRAQAGLVHVQRPGADRVAAGQRHLARRHRPISGPSTHTDARSRPTAGKSAWKDSSAGVVMLTVSPSQAAPRSPARAARRPSAGRPGSPGSWRSPVVPSASNAAAISLSTLFFAPATWTVPARRAPPVTRKRSTVRTLTGRRAWPRHRTPT